MKNRSTLIRFGMVAIVAAVLAAPATAFYWIGWPGANPITPPTIVPNTERVEERPPSGPGGEKPPPVTPPTEEPPKSVPEPTTMGIAAVGLGALAFGWWKKRKKK